MLVGVASEGSGGVVKWCQATQKEIGFAVPTGDAGPGWTNPRNSSWLVQRRTGCHSKARRCWYCGDAVGVDELNDVC